MLRKCRKHGLVKHLKRPDGAFRCSKCASAWVVASRRKKKEKLVMMLGGKCMLCGYNKYSGSLDFHHIKPSSKSFALSVKGLVYSWDILVKEAKKCALLCKNCHMEVESGMTKLLIRRR